MLQLLLKILIRECPIYNCNLVCLLKYLRTVGVNIITENNLHTNYQRILSTDETPSNGKSFVFKSHFTVKLIMTQTGGQAPDTTTTTF